MIRDRGDLVNRYALQWPAYCLLGALAALVAVSVALANDPPPEPIRVLLVTGVDHPAHHWKKTGPAIRQLLESDPHRNFEVRIVEDPEFLATDVVFDYDVVFLHFKNYARFVRQEKITANLERFVEEGRGLVALHFACGAFEDWPGFEQLVGRIWDRKTGHDPRGPFTVEIQDKEHPVTRDMDDCRTDDELYICLTGKPKVQVLATARSKVTKKDHPMAFVLHRGKGRVFHTPLGHDVKALDPPGVIDLLRRGCAWAADRETQ